MNRETVRSKVFDEERSLYNLCDASVMNCRFAGPADGESALKECRDIVVDGCSFSLRYPMWHDRRFRLLYSTMDEDTRAALWYSEEGVIEDSTLKGVKAVRECRDISISRCTIDSAEFGWKSDCIRMDECELQSEYAFLDSRNLVLKNTDFKGRYSFQYTEDVLIEDCNLDTKDAFWHSKDVTVRDSTVKGEYLGWYSENLVLENCRISGTQPLCYCRNLKLIGCTMEGCDLSFEYSDVQADIEGSIESVKNPRSGTITADSVGTMIRDDPVYECNCIVRTRDGRMFRYQEKNSGIMPISGTRSSTMHPSSPLMQIEPFIP